MKHMAISEIKEINEVWLSMPEGCSFNDALQQIAVGEVTSNGI
jgi:hypothetical protein